ncbi:phospho-2-dehydro-3-deoxyheptonate aldolase [Cyclospora cayetanensis]|uniref:Phospho-2-dehydro-3-deoxyheptonate aldolase n=1 Tax=Cyclospora cayetanensis TaxID=88456 RepID=A0A6P6RXY4_9EIME|nr:phospho-2-dehydro-3-deoxyheptonate aldolase [Cyclospora cayetanensis]
MDSKVHAQSAQTHARIQRETRIATPKSQKRAQTHSSADLVPHVQKKPSGTEETNRRAPDPQTRENYPVETHNDRGTGEGVRDVKLQIRRTGEAAEDRDTTGVPLPMDAAVRPYSPYGLVCAALSCSAPHAALCLFLTLNSSCSYVQTLATSAHFLWIGDRTRQLEFAHVEFCRGLMNPIGIKVGPTTKPAELVFLCERLNPHNQPGKVSLITRLGVENVRRCLPDLVDAVHEAAVPVLWVCDPMHGNTRVSSQGEKQRQFQDVMAEIQLVAAVLAEKGDRLGGLHLELTECLGGPISPDCPPLTPPVCDPRLNYHQSLEIAFSIGNLIGASNRRAEIDP